MSEEVSTPAHFACRPVLLSGTVDYAMYNSFRESLAARRRTALS